MGNRFLEFIIKKKKIIFVYMIMYIFCTLFCIQRYPTVELSSNELYVEHENNLKDFVISDSGLVATSNDPWINYSMEREIPVKVIELDVADINSLGGSGCVFDTDTWLYIGKRLKNGKNYIFVHRFLGNWKSRNFRFDLVDVEGATVQIEKIIINSWRGILLLTTGWFSLLAILVMLLFYLQYYISKNTDIQTKIRVTEEHISRRKFITALGLLYAVAIYPIIRANYNYIDDMGRVLIGYDGWDDFSRYMSNFLSHIIHADDYLSDISPLPQLLAVGIICFSSLIVVECLKKRITYWDVIAVLPLGLSPYFLECLSYKFDSPYMAFSILASIFPMLFYNRKRIYYCIIIVLCTIFMCTTYQASSGIFPMLVVIMSFLMWYQKEKVSQIIRFILNSGFSYLAGMGIYYCFMMKKADDYVSNGVASFQIILEHYEEYIKLICTDLKIIWLDMIVLLLVWFIIVIVWNSKQNKVKTFLISVATVIVMFLLSFGAYPFLEMPLFAPRSMYGVGIFIAFISIVGNSGKGRWVTRVITLVLGWMFIVFACTYGNALKAQDSYADFRMTEIIEDLSDSDEFRSENEKVVQLVGTIDYAPAIRNMPQDYNMLKRLVPVTFREEWFWGGYKFYNYYQFSNVKWDNAPSADVYEKWNVIHESIYHRIYANGNHIVILLK